MSAGPISAGLLDAIGYQPGPPEMESAAIALLHNAGGDDDGFDLLFTETAEGILAGAPETLDVDADLAEAAAQHPALQDAPEMALLAEIDPAEQAADTELGQYDETLSPVTPPTDDDGGGNGGGGGGGTGNGNGDGGGNGGGGTGCAPFGEFVTPACTF